MLHLLCIVVFLVGCQAGKPEEALDQLITTAKTYLEASIPFPEIEGAYNGTSPDGLPVAGVFKTTGGILNGLSNLSRAGGVKIKGYKSLTYAITILTLDDAEIYFPSYTFSLGNSRASGSLSLTSNQTQIFTMAKVKDVQGKCNAEFSTVTLKSVAKLNPIMTGTEDRAAYQGIDWVHPEGNLRRLILIAVKKALSNAIRSIDLCKLLN